MTREQKFQGILERLKEKSINFEQEHISAMVIVGYLDDLQTRGMIESAFTITEAGKMVEAICDEFEWKPSDEEIIAFVTGMVEESERPAFAFIIKKYRDDRETFLKEFDDFKNSNENE